MKIDEDRFRILSKGCRCFQAGRCSMNGEKCDRERCVIMYWLDLRELDE